MIAAAIVTDLLTMLEQIKKLEEDRKQILRDQEANLKEILQTVEDYSNKRVELFQERLREQGKTWCTLCGVKELQLTIIPEKEAEILLINRWGIRRGKEYAGDEDYSYSDLYRVCPKCRQEAADRHGNCGSDYGFHAFQVEKREDGYYAREFGNWVKLGDGYELPELPVSLVKLLPEGFNIPPLIEIERGISSKKAFTIHETDTTTNKTGV
jgi:hypothetical protein